MYALTSVCVAMFCSYLKKGIASMWLQRDNHVGDGGDEERLWSLSNGWSPKHILEQPPSQEHFPERPNDF